MLRLSKRHFTSCKSIKISAMIGMRDSFIIVIIIHYCIKNFYKKTNHTQIITFKYVT